MLEALERSLNYPVGGATARSLPQQLRSERLKAEEVSLCSIFRALKFMSRFKFGWQFEGALCLQPGEETYRQKQTYRADT